MAQLTIYLPDDVEKLVRKEARRAKKSVSAYLAELATQRVRAADEWHAQLDALWGSWEGDFPSLDDDLPPIDNPEL